MLVRGCGPTPCSLAIVGPYPGHWEDRTGRPFCGKAGDELDRLLDINRLPPRERIYLTNLHKQFKGQDYVYTAADVDVAWPWLQAELAKVKPKTIVTMGRDVTRLYLGDVDITDVEGVPWVNPANPSQVIFPVVHVAAGMRNPELSPYVIRGFQELGQYLRGKVPARVLFDDPIKEPHYELLEGDDVCRVLHVLS